MATPGKRPALARIEFLTLLLLGAIVAVVIIPKCQNAAANNAKPGENPPKHSVSKP